MREIVIKPGDAVPLGFRGENDATQILFDVSGWAEEFGEGVFQLLARLPGDEDAYTVPISYDGDYVRWTVTSGDTAITGSGAAQLEYYVGTALAKSCRYLTVVAESLGPSSGIISDAEAWAIGERDGEPVPETDETYHNNAKYYAGEAEATADAVAGGVEAAAQSATDAASSATQAAGSATAAAQSAAAAQTAAERDVPAAAAAWLAEHVDPETGYVIDNSLTIQGAAADAAVTGVIRTDLRNMCVPETHYITPFGNSGISQATGANISASNRCRTNFFFQINTEVSPVTITVPADKKLRVFEYSAANANSFIGTPAPWAEGAVTFTPTPGHYYRLAIGYITDADITGSAMGATDVSYVTYALTDKALAQPGKAADAKATGDTIADVKSRIGYRSIEKHIVIDDLTFISGGLSSSGTTVASDKLARTSNGLSFYGANTVKISLIDNLYQYSLRFYDIKTRRFLRGDSGWSAAERTIAWNDNEFLRVVVRLATNADIPNATLLHDIIRFEYTLSEIYPEPTPKGFETCGNTKILAAKTLSFTDGSQPINEYYIVASPLTRIAYRTSDFNSYEPLCVLPFAVLDHYAYGITYDDNMVAVYTIQSLNDARFVDQNNGTDSCRKPFYVFLYSEDYQVAHKVDLTTSNRINPTGWLSNSGFYAYNGGFLFCEYTRTIVETCNIWKVTGDITTPGNWVVKLQLSLSGVNTGLKHMHCLVQDPFTNYLYMSTGDDDAGAATYYSTDLGETWVLLHSGEEKYDRYLNLVFTKDYIYYATDSFKDGMHYLYRTIRVNGIMSFADIEILQDLNNRLVASYGTVYLPTLNKLFLPERRDTADGNDCNIIVYDIDTNTVATFDTLYSTGNIRLGFRCNYIDYVSRDNIVRCGFGASFPLHNGGYANYFNVFDNAGAGFPVSQCNNLFLRFGENHVAIDTNTH